MKITNIAMAALLALAATGGTYAAPVPVSAAAVRAPVANPPGYDMLPAAEQNADYWIARGQDMETVLSDRAGIARLNADLRARNATLRDMTAYPATLSYDELRQRIEHDVPDWDTYYVHGRQLSYDEYIAACRNRQMALPETAEVRYGVTVRRANMRLLPVATSAGWFGSPSDTHFDSLQGTAVNPGEPVAILHESQDGQWLLVDTRDYTGWLPCTDIATTTREQMQEWARVGMQGTGFVVVTANRLYVTAADGQRLLYQLGSRLPLVDAQGHLAGTGEADAAAAAESGTYTVAIPRRAADGSLRIERAALTADDTVHRGFLPWTRANILRMAFTCLGDVYGWGGLEASVDCSSFVQDVYRTVGIELPRDANQQDAVTRVRDLSGLSYDGHVAALNEARPGDLFFIGQSHVMLSLGSENGQPYIINSTSSYYTGGAKHYILKVVASGVGHYTHGASSVTAIGSLSR